MELKKENEDLCKASVLKISVKVHNSKFTIKLWIIDCLSLLYQLHALLDSRIPSKTFYASSGSTIPHIARVT